MANCAAIWKGKVIKPLFFFFSFLKLLNRKHDADSIRYRLVPLQNDTIRCNSILAVFISIYFDTIRFDPIFRCSYYIVTPLVNNERKKLKLQNLFKHRRQIAQTEKRTLSISDSPSFFTYCTYLANGAFISTVRIQFKSL